MNEFENKNVQNDQPAPETTEEIVLNENVATSADEIAQSTNPLTTTTNLVQGVMHEKDMKSTAQKQAVGKILGQVGLYTFLTIMALVVVFPFIWMLATSLKSVPEYYSPSLELVLFPNGPRDFLNYAEVFSTTDLENYFLNTLIIGVASTLMSLVITILSAFALSRLDFKGKNILFAGLLATMMIPGELFTITNYKTVADFGWLMQFGEGGFTNAFLNLTMPFLVSVFYIYLLKQNFMQIPDELYLAAKVDGTTDFKYLIRVMIPLALPTLISITILKMMGAWNTYMWPKLTTTNPDYYLITIGLREAFTSADNQQPDIPLQMAAVTMVSIPLFLVFVFLRKYIMKGVSRSGIKG